jgi:hypothetical protein
VAFFSAVSAALNSSRAYTSAPAVRADSIALRACCSSLSGGSPQDAATVNAATAAIACSTRRIDDIRSSIRLAVVR